MKNHYWGAFIISFLLLVILFMLYFLPPFEFAGWKLRRVDMLADIRLRHDTVSSDTVILDSIVRKKVKPEFVDTCRTGLTCIVDYSDSTSRGMSHFYQILDSVGKIGRPVRIAVFGDSFIEGDIFTADLRKLFQNRFGGCGVGYVNITSNIAGFRPTVRHRFSGWISKTAADSIYDRSKLGLNSAYFMSQGKGSWVELAGTSYYSSNTDSAECSAIYFESMQDSTDIYCSLNNSEPFRKVSSGRGLKKLSVEGNIRSVKWITGDSCRALYYGVTMESRHGIIVDNLSLRGSGGYNLLSVPESRLRDFARLREYDLIILQYGLNVATRYGKKYDKYYDAMSSAVKKMKRCFPESSILVVSVGDRMMKDEDGNLVTMPGVRNLVKYQEAIAADNSVAYWNMYELFKSLGGIEAFVNARPSMANLDYTHINFRGGARLAECFFDAIVYGKDTYDRKLEYEKE